MKRQRVQSYVPRQLQERLRMYCGVKSISESALIQTLIEGHLDGQAADADVIARRLDRGAVALGRVERDMAVLSEAVAVLAHFCFAHAPEISDATRRAAARQLAKTRYDQLVAAVEERLRDGPRLMTEVVKQDPFVERGRSADGEGG